MAESDQFTEKLFSVMSHLDSKRNDFTIGVTLMMSSKYYLKNAWLYLYTVKCRRNNRNLPDRVANFAKSVKELIKY